MFFTIVSSIERIQKHYSKAFKIFFKCLDDYQMRFEWMDQLVIIIPKEIKWMENTLHYCKFACNEKMIQNSFGKIIFKSNAAQVSFE